MHLPQGRAWQILLLVLAGALPTRASEPQAGQPAPTASPLAAPVPSTPVVKQHQVLRVPRLDAAPRIEDFLSMEPSPAWAGKMLKIDRFYQREPKDGAPVSQRTEVYLGYTDKNLYAIFVCFDSEPEKLRARMERRENILEDDQIGLNLDTFNDKRRAYTFGTNPLGIQLDAIFTDDRGFDFSFDQVWRSDGRLTERGYLVWMEVPFKSLRFPRKPTQRWGLFLERDIPQRNEFAFFPHLSTDVQGMLRQEAEIEGLENISPGRNLQFIPYGSFRAFRALDERDPTGARFTGKRAEPTLGLDAKVVLKDSLVLDLTVNPDFSQVESDEPQTTVNQRFEVFFPEKRPFFLENASFFTTPIDLLFTRRIADPRFGARLTGKLGRWGIGLLVADDESPSRRVAESDPLSGREAYYGVLRVNREFGRENSLGILYTGRELHTEPATSCDADACTVGSNRMGGLDGHFKFSKNWLFDFQGVFSRTKFSDGSALSGHSFQAFLQRSSRKVEFNSLYIDTAPGFRTLTGFFRRPDIRRFSNFLQYRFRPEGKHLILHGPSLFTVNLWDQSGTRLEYFGNVNYRWSFQRQTLFLIYGNLGHERLRPEDFSELAENRDYGHHQYGFVFETAALKWLTIKSEVYWGVETNFVPRTGPPVLANSNWANVRATVRPIRGLTIENTWLLTRLREQATERNIFNNHILRSKWNYQFSKEFSLRVIGQYNANLVNPALTTLTHSKSFNADVLFTYLWHPGTAIYVGYNSNLQNLDRSLGLDPDGNLLRTRNRFLNDGRQIFVKVSYLFRF